MTKITKHVGLDANTREILFIIYPILPESKSHCLVTYIDKVSPELRAEVAEIMASNEGQGKTNLADVLHTRLYSGSGRSVLETLHSNGYLVKKNIEEVMAAPMPGVEIPLPRVLVESGLLSLDTPQEVEKFNPHLHNSDTAQGAETLGVAHNLLAQAEMLELDARNKRAEAYRLAPSLKPTAAVDTPAIPAL